LALKAARGAERGWLGGVEVLRAGRRIRGKVSSMSICPSVWMDDSSTESVAVGESSPRRSLGAYTAGVHVSMDWMQVTHDRGHRG
jgi:hypothetical protein